MSVCLYCVCCFCYISVCESGYFKQCVWSVYNLLISLCINLYISVLESFICVKYVNVSVSVYLFVPVHMSMYISGVYLCICQYLCIFLVQWLTILCVYINLYMPVNISVCDVDMFLCIRVILCAYVY